jgi:hypothetical protein
MKRSCCSYASWAFLICVPWASFAECPVTLPATSPVAVPHGTSTERRWYGSDALAVLVPADGRWKGMGPSRNWGDKFWVWRRGYDAKQEPKPALTFTGVKLDDGQTPARMKIEKATNAFGDGWNSMLAPMSFPSAGCWQVTATYVYLGIAQDLTFVLDVVTD